MGLFLAMAVPARAQLPASGLPQPRLFTIVPCGGKLGSTFEVTFTGQDIDDPKELIFSTPAIKATPIVPPTPAPDPKKPGVKPPTPPVTTFKVTIAANAALGVHDVRLVNKWGVSNPRAFVVGDLEEVREKDPNDDVPQAQRVPLNCTINGTIAAPTDVDYYVFAGKRGQRVLASCLASTIDSRLLAGVDLFDAAGHRLATNRRYLGTDALADATLPADGDYYVRVYEFTHAEGSLEHSYRLSITTAPWIDAIVPLAVEPGKPATLTIYGRNLPGGQPDPAAQEGGRVLEKVHVTFPVPGDPASLEQLPTLARTDPRASALDGFEYRLASPAGTSNPFRLTFARAPVVIDSGKHDTPETAQAISVPCEISGAIEKRHDRDWYVFSAKKNDTYIIEVFSDRLGAPIDTYFVLRNAENKQELANQDDNPDTLTPVKFYTRSDDPPPFRFVAPADGKYQLLVSSRDADNRYGPRRGYRVRIAPEKPDFRLVVLPGDELRPDASCLLQGGREQLTVLAWRLDGFTGPIRLTVDGLPTGVTAPPQTLGPNLRQTPLVVSAAANAPVWTGPIRIRGEAVINGRSVVHEARTASITWPVPQPQGIPALSRLDRGFYLSVREKAPFNLTITPDKTTVLQGTKINLALKLARLWPDFKTPLQVQPFEPAVEFPPELVFNANNQPLTMAPGKDDASAILEVKPTVPPGIYNVVLRGTAQVPYNKDPMAKEKPNINLVHPANPLEITVLPSQVATLSVDNANPTLKLGTQTAIVVKAARMHNYTGPIDVQLVTAPALMGVSADAASIPAGKDETKLVLKAPAAIAVGNRPNLVVRATARVAPNITVSQEIKISVNVVK